MSQGGTTPKAAPIGWVFFDRHRRDGFTVRWRRGDPVAYVLEGKRIGDCATGVGVLDTIPVTPSGWTDLAEVRLLGQRWLRTKSA